jgi:hypothetical protein
VLWLAFVLQGGPASVTPVDSAASSIVGYITGFGALGIAALALASGWLVPKGTADRLIKEKQQAEEQRDEALKIATHELVPLLTSFTATTSALIPLLQEVVRNQEGGGHGPARRPR